MNYIDVIDDQGNSEKMEVISTFKLLGYKYNYLIYRKLDKSAYYTAKYEGEDMIDLDTNFSDSELALINKIMKGIIK